MGMILDAQDCLVRMLSRCHALQNWGSATYTESQLLERIYVEAIPEPANGSTHTKAELEDLRPYVLVGADTDRAISIKRDGMGGGSSFNPSGSLLVMIEQQVIDGTEAEIDRDLYTLLDGMLYTGNAAEPGLLDQLDQADSINIMKIDCQGIFRIMPEEVVSKGDAQRAYLRIEWGT